MLQNFSDEPYWTVSTICAIIGQDEGGCDPFTTRFGNLYICEGECSAAYFCNGTRVIDSCRSGEPIEAYPPFLSNCTDDATVNCGQALRGAGACLIIGIFDEFGNQIGATCGNCAVGAVDPDIECDSSDVDLLETDCEGGGAPV